ncbi:hypothetical protein VULLAG_LOCUS10779 [Vulpes lagopus]
MPQATRAQPHIGNKHKEASEQWKLPGVGFPHGCPRNAELEDRSVRICTKKGGDARGYIIGLLSYSPVLIARLHTP